MFELKFDVSAFERKAVELNAALDQVPYALSLALNQAVTNARKVLINDTWPSHVQMRNPSFLRGALRLKFSTKRDLRAEVYDALGRGNLEAHAHGGKVRPKQARVFAVPLPGAVRRTAKGVRSSDLPRNLRNAFVTPKGVFQRLRGGGLRKVYSFAPSVTI